MTWNVDIAMADSEVRIVLTGAPSVGKSSYSARFLGEEYESEIEGVGTGKMNKVSLMTDQGPVTVSLWDGPITDSVLLGAHGAILMFDVTSRSSYNALPTFFRDVVRVTDGIPIVLCGNKVDCADRKVKPRNITYHRRKNLQYYELSARANFNIEKPIIYILRKVFDNPNLVLTEGPAIYPADVAISYDQVAVYEQELELASRMCLPDDDDDDDF